MSKTSGSSWERQLIESYIPHIPLVMFPPLFFLRVVKPVPLCPVHNETRLVVYSNKRKMQCFFGVSNVRVVSRCIVKTPCNAAIALLYLKQVAK